MSLFFYMRYCCYKLLSLLGISRQKHKDYQIEDPQDERGHITASLQLHEDEVQPRTKPLPRTVSEALETEGLLMDQNPTSIADPKLVPTKEPLIDISEPVQSENSNEIKAVGTKPFNIKTQSFKINLEPYQNFFQVLQNKTKNLEQKLNANGTLVEIEKTPYDLEIRHNEVGKLNIFAYRFRLPCTYSFYSQMLNDYLLQKRLDSNIDEYKMLELYANNLRLNYLSYKKVLIVSPRDFAYLKYSVNADNQYWDISFSIPYESYPNKVRGQIILSSCKVIESGEEIQVQIYSQVDMKLSVSPKITKNQAVNEIKKYVDKCDKYVRENYRRQIV